MSQVTQLCNLRALDILDEVDIREWALDARKSRALGPERKKSIKSSDFSEHKHTDIILGASHLGPQATISRGVVLFI